MIVWLQLVRIMAVVVRSMLACMLVFMGVLVRVLMLMRVLVRM